ncbi:hypothetical protein WJX81_008693 [Elliptochloris bilobata]|uniref:Nucleoporin Nup133/Nup155-like N-terminal domain-containing protein n=1 Tax=Elliptochloris bilobata TaxID=381761 RepID=A0AAW1R343_9CHLO
MLWRFQEGGRARVYTQGLAYASAGRHHVAIVKADGATTTVVLSTEDGNVTLLRGELDASEALTLAASALGAASGAASPAQAVGLGRWLGWSGGTLSGSRASGGAARGAPGIAPAARGSVLALRLLPIGRQTLLLLALTQAGLECWQVPSGGTGVLLWTAASPGQGSVRLLDLALVPLPNASLPAAAVLAADDSGQLSVHLSVHVLEGLGAGAAPPPWRDLGAVRGRNAEPALRLAAAAGAGAFLLWRPGGALHRWHPGEAAMRLRDSCRSVATAPDGAAWLVLDGDAGISAIAVHTPAMLDESAPDAGSEPLTEAGMAGEAANVVPGEAEDHPAAAAAFRLLDAALSRRSGGRGGGLMESLRETGALQASGAANAVALYSTRLVDTLPKHWGGGPSSGPGSAGDVAVALAQKLERHGALLHALGANGLAALDPATVRVLMENGERVAAVAAVRAAENRVLTARGRDPTALPSPLQAAIASAGRRCMPRVADLVDNRSEWELFYAAPSHSAPAFFAAVAEQAPALDGSSEAAAACDPMRVPGQGSFMAAQALDQLAELARAVQGAIAAAQQRRAAHGAEFAAATGKALRGGAHPEWLADRPARGALLALSRALIRLGPALRSEAPDRAAGAAVLLAELAERLLNAFAAAAADVSVQAAAAVGIEYGAARGEVLQALLEQALRFQEQGEAAGAALVARLEGLAEAHGAHAQLFELCETQGNWQRLLDHMAASLAGGERGLYAEVPLAGYVFRRLREDGRTAELLCLPDAFGEELLAWLARQGEDAETLRLRWLHELRLGRPAAAASTLDRSAARGAATCTHAARLACLAKLAAAAAAPGGLAPAPPQVAAHKQRQDARLALLAVQQALGLGNQPPLPPADLVTAGLYAGDVQGAVLAFDVLAAAGRAFCKEHRDMVAATWQAAARASDWPRLSAERPRLPDAAFAALLAGTPLAAAARRCYSAQPGDRALSADDRFEDACAPEEAEAALAEVAAELAPTAAADMQSAFVLGMAGQTVESFEEDDMQQSDFSFYENPEDMYEE